MMSKTNSACKTKNLVAHQMDKVLAKKLEHRCHPSDRRTEVKKIKSDNSKANVAHKGTVVLEQRTKNGNDKSITRSSNSQLINILRERHKFEGEGEWT